MKAKDIEVGGHYKAKVSGKLVTVRVDDTQQQASYHASSSTRTTYNVTNLSTGRKTMFRSAARFRTPAANRIAD